MGDSDEEYDRRSRARDKFRRERNDYERRDERRRESWEDRGGRENWGRREGRREMYGRDYERGSRRERYSPGRHDISPPVKRMRREWYGDSSSFKKRDDGGFSHYDMPYGGGGGPMGGPQHHDGGGRGGRGGGWGGPGRDDMPPPQQPSYRDGGGGGPPSHRGPDPDFPTQPPMMTFKQFLAQQEDSISDEEAIRRFNEYKLDFRKQQINEFFLAHKDEEWFKAKYHPEECGRKKEEAGNSLKRRAEIFTKLMELGRVEPVGLDVEKTEEIVRLLDAAVILMEGGTEFDLNALDMPDNDRPEEGMRSRTTSENQPVERSFSRDSDSKKEDGEMDDQDEEKAKEKPLELPMGAKEEELMKAAQEFTQTPKDADENGEAEGKKKKRHRDKSEYNYESGSESESGSDSDAEPRPPGVEDEPPPPGVEPGEDTSPVGPPGLTTLESRKKEEESEEIKEKDASQEKEDEEQEKEKRPRAFHRTNSIFLRNLAPTITRQEVEAMCKRYPGFMRVALQDPQPERRFARRGWVTFDRTVNIKDICWNLNNIRLRDCEMGAIVNRELKQRVRPVNGITLHKPVVRSDISNAAIIIQNLDKKWNIWDDSDEEKQENDKEVISLGLVSKNPVLHNITDYLVEEGSYEEEELLGVSVDDKPKDSDPEVSIDQDPSFLQVLDRMILYLRIVHSYDYYSAVEYPNEDEMPHRCGIMHARGPSPGGKVTQNDVNEWITSFENKVKPVIELKLKLDDQEVQRLGKKDPEAEVEKFITANTQELAKDKWLCPLSGKKFKGPEFVRKHIFNKHAEKVEEVKQEVSFFNHYLMDPKRPQLPDHPGNRQQAGGGHAGGGQRDSYRQGGGGGSYQGPPQQGMMGGGGYSQHQNPHSMYPDNRRNRGGGFHTSPRYQGHGGPDMYRRDNRNHRENFLPRRDRGRADPRSIIEYRDLDAPDDLDIF